MTALCASRPADWWDTGDDGNRLALLLCRACPARARCARMSRDEYGVIRAGVAYGDTGKELPVCHCGYPVVGYRGGPVACCFRCGVAKPTVEESAARDRGLVDEAVVQRLMDGEPPEVVSHADRREAMRRLWAAGLSHREVAARLRMGIKAVRRARQRMVAS